MWEEISLQEVQARMDEISERHVWLLASGCGQTSSQAHGKVLKYLVLRKTNYVQNATAPICWLVRDFMEIISGCQLLSWSSHFFGTFSLLPFSFHLCFSSTQIVHRWSACDRAAPEPPTKLVAGPSKSAAKERREKGS